jgi:DNA-binding response OmpR family regulator
MTHRILLASSVKSERDQIRQILLEVNFGVEVLESPPSELAEEAFKCDIALIDADFGSPGQGWTLARELKSKQDNKRIGVIILTRSSPYEFMEAKDFSNSYDQVLHFPVSVEELVDNIERIMVKIH